MLWEGERIREDSRKPVLDKNTGSFEETISFRRMRRGIVHIMNHMHYQISGKPESEWFTWVQDLKHDHLTHLPPKPPIQFSLHEVIISEVRFKVISKALKLFLLDLKSGTYPFKRGHNPEGSGDHLVTALDRFMEVKKLKSGKILRDTPKKRPRAKESNGSSKKPKNIFDAWDDIQPNYK